MSCVISRGRKEECKDNIAGLNAIYFWSGVDFIPPLNIMDVQKDANGFIISSNAMNGAILFKYELKGTSNYSETVTTSRDNGTTAFTQTLVVNLKKLTSEMRTQLQLLAAGKNRIFIHTNNGDCLLMGEKRFADLTAGSLSTGSQMTDLYGYSLTFTSMERETASFVYGSTKEDPFAYLSTTTEIGIDTDGSFYAESMA